MKARDRAGRILGAMLGCAVGDALGLPYENLSARRGPRLLGPPDRYRFWGSTGWVSDDTEHTWLVAESLARAPVDRDRFARELAGRMRWWLAAVPAGIGRATLRATIKLWLGFPPDRSGVFSAGNGAAMRTAVLGAALDEPHELVERVRIATVITHRDPKAFHGALAVAAAARHAGNEVVTPEGYARECRVLFAGERADEMHHLIDGVVESVGRSESTREYMERVLGRRAVSGYVYHTVPVALHAWLSHPEDFPQAVQETILCGGDTDTAAAIVGAVVGSRVGTADMPEEWLERLESWPRSNESVRRLSVSVDEALLTRIPQDVPQVPWVKSVRRNLVFLAVVLLHVARRFLPPY